jgi:hypothetical protein
MKIVTIVTAGLVAMLSVAAAATPAAAHPYDRYAGGGRSFFASLFGPSIARGVVGYPTNQKLIPTTSTFAVALFSAPCSGRRSPAWW